MPSIVQNIERTESKIRQLIAALYLDAWKIHQLRLIKQQRFGQRDFREFLCKTSVEKTCYFEWKLPVALSPLSGANV